MTNIRKKNAELRRKRGRKKTDLRLASEYLGVTYGHLRLVVKGERISPELLQSYRDWLKLRPKTSTALAK